jgi:hypothetical protein
MGHKNCNDCKFSEETNPRCVIEGCYRYDKWEPKEPPFEPEYLTGINRKDAKDLLGKPVEFSHYGHYWSLGQLVALADENEPFGVDYKGGTEWVHYIRTTPETHAHPTINIGGAELPRPEVDAPEKGDKYWVWNPNRQIKSIWENDMIDKDRLLLGQVHLTGDRAQAWASWWSNTVMAAVRGGE